MEYHSDNHERDNKRHILAACEPMCALRVESIVLQEGTCLA